MSIIKVLHRQRLLTKSRYTPKLDVELVPDSEILNARATVSDKRRWASDPSVHLNFIVIQLIL